MPITGRFVFALLGGVVLWLAMPGRFSANRRVFGWQDLPHKTTLSSADVSQIQNADGWVLVDTRATDAFNGWALDGIARGGHIPDAVDFPAQWLDLKQQDKAARLATAL